ncbi:MAG: deoxyribonuclease IV [Bacillota bacterium]
MRFGMHMPLKGGFSRNINRAAELGCRSLQIFAGNPTAWRLQAARQEEIDERRRLLAERDIYPLVIHAAYLVNMASANEVFLKRSCQLMQETMERAALLGSPYVVMHVGSHGGKDFEAGMELFITTLERELEKWTPEVTLLLENTAGAGSSLGGSFNSLGHILKKLGPNVPVGICLDTAHAWAAGYDFSSAEGARASMEELFSAVGMEKILALHVNNINSPRGNHRDRHIHLREGLIPLEAYSAVLAYPWPEDLPVILETPEIGSHWDAVNLADLCSCAKAGEYERSG